MPSETMKTFSRVYLWLGIILVLLATFSGFTLEFSLLNFMFLAGVVMISWSAGFHFGSGPESELQKLLKSINNGDCDGI